MEKKKEVETTRATLVLNKELLAKLDEQAEKESRSRSNMMVTILNEYFSKK